MTLLGLIMGLGNVAVILVAIQQPVRILLILPLAIPAAFALSVLGSLREGGGRLPRLWRITEIVGVLLNLFLSMVLVAVLLTVLVQWLNTL